MKVRKWLSSSSSNSIDTAAETPHRNLHFSSSTASSSSDSNTNTSNSSNTTLLSNLSLQTLPSVPSLQKVSPHSVKLTVTSLSLKPPSSSHGVINFLAVHSNLLYAASGNSVNVFDVNTFTLIDAFNCSSSSSCGSVKSISFYGKLIFTGHQDCKIRAWNFTENNPHKLVATLPTVQDRLLRSLFPINYVKVRRHKKRIWIHHNDAVSGLDIAARGFICSISWDKCLKIWRSSDFRCVQSVKAHDDAINAVVTSLDGTIYTGSADRKIKVWGIPAGEERHALIATLEKHKSTVNALALNDDGSVLFSGACDRSILVWEKEDSANHMVVTGALRGHGKAILCLINVSDLLFSGSADQTVRIWQKGYDERYCCLTVLDGHDTPVRSLVAVSDETYGARHGTHSKYTRLRCFDLWKLHSWASGLAEFADGRNQESTSEAVNAYYSAALMGLAYGDSHLVAVESTLSAMEIHSTQTWWQ